MMSEVTRLHIGCGNNVLEGFENIDIQTPVYVPPNVKFSKCDAYPLTGYADETFDVVYACHVLEHLNKNKIDIIREWARVLKPKGTLRISVPAFEAMVEIYKKTGDIRNVNGLAFGVEGIDDIPEERHYELFDLRKLTYYMEKAGLMAIHEFNPFRQINKSHFDFSMARTVDIPISLNLEGFKPLKDRENERI